MMNDSPILSAICLAFSMGMPMAISSGGNQMLPVGSVGPRNMVFLGAFSAMPAGYVI